MKRYLFVLLAVMGSCAEANADKAPTTAPAECKQRYDAKQYQDAMRVCMQHSTMPEAQYYIGRMHEKGQGVPSDMTVARGWYDKAASANHAESQYRISAAYRFGAGG